RNNGNGNPDENGKGAMPDSRVCTYQDFMKCQPLNFKGTEGVVYLTRWFENIETLFYISNCPEVYQVKNATCTLLVCALTWWNSHERKVGVDAMFVMTWRDLMKLMTKVRGRQIERYIRGLPNNIQGNVMSAENKRNFESNQRDNRIQQPSFKRQNVGGSNVARAYTVCGNEERVYVGPHPLCNQCKLHHVGPCTVKCRSCGKIGYLTRDCKLAAPSAANRKAPVVNQRIATCFECGRQGNFKKDCLKLKNQNHENKPAIPKARGKAYAIGGGDANPRSNVVTVMSDASFAVTYTSVYTDFEPWRYYGEDSAETGPPRPVAPPFLNYVSGPEHPPSLDYVLGPEHPPSPIQIPYVPELEYPEYLAPSDDKAPLEDQHLPVDASPIAVSPDYVADSDPEEDHDDDQADYPADEGDGDDEPFDDDDDNDTNDEDPEEEPFEEDDEKEEEPPDPADSSTVPIVDLVLPAGDTEALEADEPTHVPGSPIIIPFS
nr:hypothetical protein [Tanacetum cinerariifolium]